MKKLTVLVALMFLAGCVPREAIVPSYNGPDAVTLFFFHPKGIGAEQYIEMDNEIITVLVGDGKAMARVGPGLRVLYAKSSDYSVKPLPLKIDLQIGSVHYFDVDQLFGNYLRIQEVSRSAFDRLMKEADDRFFKQGKK